MASSGKRKTTMAKLNRERKLIEKRHAKQIKKDARKQAAADGLTEPGGGIAYGEGPAADVTVDEDTPDAVTADEPLAR